VDVPKPVRAIVEAIVNTALLRCDREGIPHRDFYEAMVEERKLRSTGDLPDLIKRTFARLGRGRN
jgi:hypothetical protein